MSLYSYIYDEAAKRHEEAPEDDAILEDDDISPDDEFDDGLDGPW